ncbi:serine hydrolase [Mucilaginibacter sp.]|uniref:serine hydrolase domain-containing protein n=1 Tax=Mucilaginibacter sp. TaxID=1882438 RepID=UPI002840F260|nr:serine hydrolase [Mucilaginibacter sp.]MDR3693900.1 serine hydrolase [Mucilaginibacter sp.]
MPLNCQPVSSCLKSIKKCLSGLALLLLLISSGAYAQKTIFFPHSLPETEGVSAAGIDSFLTAVAQSKHEFHSIMILRHGKVVAEGWWNPYRPDLKHSLYSCSKSFTSTAVGFAISEKLLSLNDKVTSFFPESLPDTVKPYLAKLTIKDLLTMSVGQDPDPTSIIPFTSANWIKSFLATPIKNEPGTKFLYNTMATYMLSAIIQKVTGQKVVDYLKPRLFDPLGITGMDWEVDTKGINTGGWGLRVKTEDLAKMGQLYLQKGIWDGKHVLPKGWVEEATTFKIDQAPGAAQSKKDSSDWMQGYCYQFWRCRHNAFRADGAFGQYIIVMPDQDAVIAITSETADMQGELNLVWRYLLPAMHQQPSAINKVADEHLNEHLASLSLAPAGNNGQELPVHNATYMLKPNGMHCKSISFHYDGSVYKVSFRMDTTAYELNFGIGKWLPGETRMAGPSLLNGAKEDFSVLLPYKIDGSCATLGVDGSLQFKLRYIESPHSETITCHFNGQELNAAIEYSFNYGKSKMELQGTEAAAAQ